MPSAHGPKVEAFYRSRPWKRARRAALLRANGLCERCGARRAVIVHHIEPLTEENIDDLAVALGLDNMIAVCIPCHNQIHGAYDSGGRPDLWVKADGTIAEIGGGRLDPNMVREKRDESVRRSLDRGRAKQTPPRGIGKK